MNLFSKFILFAALLSSFENANAISSRVVTIAENQLSVDGTKQPQLFGAELQYFRLRGGYGKNIPRAKVIALWNKALDRMVEAKMNAVSFYIPWDFHEYAEGKFDFDGTVDEDGDGNPDYPSRDVKTFFKLIAEHGIKHIMVRPGPYINAEWGFLGFGAIPEWFHNKFPESHMRTSSGWKSKLYDYHNPDFLRYTEVWFEHLYNEVLKENIGAGKPIEFVQLDNETNLQWQSMFNHDYSPAAVDRYRAFLRTRYADVNNLNQAHSRQWKNWGDVRPPVQPGVNNAEDNTWYEFQDFSMYEYLTKIRRIWEKIGVREPEVMFTLAESYNATANGILPNYIYRNAPGTTGMMTVNLYPKTYETNANPLHNLPFKTDLDIISADEGNNHYLQRQEDWVLGPEVQAGWWRGIGISAESRQQTYLSAVGHGMKALFLYYFNEGDNWNSEWAYERVAPIFQQLKVEWNVETTETNRLSNEFWDELQARSDRSLLAGFDVRYLMQHPGNEGEKLYFDAPLNGNAEPGPHFAQLKMLGEKIFNSHENFLAKSTNLFDSIALVKDSTSQAPGPEMNIDSLLAASEWSGGLLGYLMNEGINARVLLGETSPATSFLGAKLLVHIDTGLNSRATLLRLGEATIHGQGILNFLSNRSLKNLGAEIPGKVLPNQYERVTLAYFTDEIGRLVSKDTPGAKEVQFKGARPFFSYDMSQAKACEAMLYWNEQVIGYRCLANASTVVQIGALLFDDYNSNDYATLIDPIGRRNFLHSLLLDFGIEPLLKINPEAMRVAAFARMDPEHSQLWITVKTAHQKAQPIKIVLDPSTLPGSIDSNFTVENLLSGELNTEAGAKLISAGFSSALKPEDSTVFLVKQKAEKK